MPISVGGGGGSGLTEPVSVDDNGGSLTIDGTVTADAGIGPWPVTDNGGSLTIDGTVSVNALPAGSNNIGDVDVLTQPARVATTDSITAKLATDAIQNGLTALTPKFAPIAAASSGNNTLVAAVGGKKIRVLALMGIVSAATSIYFDDTNSTVIFGGSTNKMELAANQGFVLPMSPIGWMETGSGFGLRVNLSAANKFSGGLVYVEV